MEFDRKEPGARIQEPGGGGVQASWGKDDLFRVISVSVISEQVRFVVPLTEYLITDTLITDYLKRGR
jgi:hypothetical protein